LVKWSRRHPAKASLLGLGSIASAAIMALLALAEANIRQERNNALEHDKKATAAAREALESREQTRQNLYAADMLLAQHALRDGNLGLARTLVNLYGPKSPNAASPSSPVAPDLRGFEWRYLWKECQGDRRETLYGHSNRVECVAFSSDGWRLATGDASGKVFLWDAASRRVIDKLDVSDAPVGRVTFSPDGNKLGTGDLLGRLRIWDLAARRTVWERTGRNIAGLQFSPDGRSIGFTSGDMTQATNSAAHVLNWKTGEELVQAGPCADFEAFSPDGKLAFVTRKLEVGTEIWDIAARRVVKTIPEWNGSFVVSPDGRYLAGVGSSRGIFLASLAGPARPAFLGGNGGLNLAVAFSTNGATLASAGSDQVLRLWNVAEQRETGRLLGHTDAITGATYSPDGRLLATSSADQTVTLWPTAREDDAEIITNTWPPYVLSSDGEKLAAETADAAKGRARVQILDLATHRSTTLSQPDTTLTPGFFSADGATFWARGQLSAEGKLPLIRWEVGALARPPATVWINLGRANQALSAAANAGGNIFALGQYERQPVTLWRITDGAALGQLTTPPNEYAGAPYRYSPDGRKLLSYIYASTIRLTDLGAPNKTMSVDLRSRTYESDFSPDGKLLAVACEDHTIRLLDASTLREVAILRGHQQQVTCAAFTPDGRTLASCGSGGVVKLWNLAARREMATLVQGKVEYCFVAFSPDGNTLVAGGWGQTRVLRVPSPGEIDGHP
jgi:WD40 repeat protein